MKKAARQPEHPPDAAPRWSHTQRVGIALVAVAAFFFVANFANKAWTSYQAKQQVQVVNEQITAITAQNNQLRQQIAYDHTKQYVVRVARDKLLYVQPGDIILRVQAPVSSATSAP